MCVYNHIYLFAKIIIHRQFNALNVNAITDDNNSERIFFSSLMNWINECEIFMWRSI